MELNHKNVRKILLIITFTIVLFVAAQNLRFVVRWFSTFIGYFYPVIIGLCIAFVLNILMSVLEKNVFFFMKKNKHKFVRKLCRPICIILTLLITFGAIVLVIVFIIPEFIDIFQSLRTIVPQFIRNTVSWIENTLSQFNIAVDLDPNAILNTIDWNQFSSNIMNFLTNLTSSDNSILSGVVNVTSSIFSGISNTIFSFVIAVYVMAKKESIGWFIIKAINALIPQKIAKPIYKVSTLTYSAFSNFISGQFAEAIIIGVLCYIGMLIIRIPNAEIISMIIGVTAIVPIVGALVGMIVSALLLVINTPFKALIFIVFILLLQQFENSFIYPKVVGKSVGLPGLIVFSAVLVGGNIGGVAGALVAVPISAVLFTLLKEAIDKNPAHTHTLRKKKAAASADRSAEQPAVPVQSSKAK